MSKENIWSKEPEITVDDSVGTLPQQAEMINGRWAMIGFLAAIGAYITTGQIIPGIF
tara:strand:- start:131 stop:301 length:171 start_codon:yes stop_codon:yes gene_type:complete